MDIRRKIQRFLGVESTIREVTDRRHNELRDSLRDGINMIVPEDFDVGFRVKDFRLTSHGVPMSGGLAYDKVTMSIYHDNPHKFIFCVRGNKNHRCIIDTEFKHHWEMTNYLEQLDWCVLRKMLKGKLKDEVQIGDLLFTKGESGGFSVTKIKSGKRICWVNQKGMVALKQWITDITKSGCTCGPNEGCTECPT